MQMPSEKKEELREYTLLLVGFSESLIYHTNSQGTFSPDLHHSGSDPRIETLKPMKSIQKRFGR